MRCINRQLFELCFQTYVFCETVSSRVCAGYIVILSKNEKVNKKMSNSICKRLTLAQCVDVQCRPTVEDAIHCTLSICILCLCA